MYKLHEAMPTLAHDIDPAEFAQWNVVREGYTLRDLHGFYAAGAGELTDTHRAAHEAFLRGVLSEAPPEDIDAYRQYRQSIENEQAATGTPERQGEQ